MKQGSKLKSVAFISEVEDESELQLYANDFLKNI